MSVIRVGWGGFQHLLHVLADTPTPSVLLPVTVLLHVWASLQQAVAEAPGHVGSTGPGFIDRRVCLRVVCLVFRP